MKRILFVFSAVFLLTAFISCGDKPTGESAETTTSGEIAIGVDDAYKLLVDAEVDVFENDYRKAKIHPVYASEGEVIDLMKKDSVRLVVISRKLNDQEKKFFNDKDIHPRETKVAYDGLAFISNKSNMDSTFSYAQLEKLFRGLAGKWSDFDPAGSNDSVRIVFDHPRSGNARYIRDLFAIEALPANCFAVRSNEEVLKYVENHPGTIGVIGSNYISDPDDSTSQNFLKRVRVLAVSSQNDPQALNGYRQPYQEYISEGTYPFKREVYIISRELGTHLGSGFTSFFASDKGQRVVLKSGLLPAVVPVRFVNIISE